MLRVQGERCVILGGGVVARRRAQTLLAAGARVVVVTPEVTQDFEGLDVEIIPRPYQYGDLAGARFVVIATNDPEMNSAAGREAREMGVLINRADDPAAGDCAIPAHAHHGPLTIAVHTSGISAGAAATIRRELSAALDPDWPRLLEVVAPYRLRIKQNFADDRPEREKRLTGMTNARAMNMLKAQGPEAVRRYCEGLAEPGQPVLD